MARILIIEDDPQVQLNLATMTAQLGHHVCCASSLQEGLQQAQDQNHDLILLDVRLPDGLGLDILPALRRAPGSPEVIILTGYADPDDLEQAISQGGWDYLQKPLCLHNLRLVLLRALQFRQEKRRLSPPPVQLRFPGLVGHSASLQPCLTLLSQAAESDVNVLLTGETGTGKELFARAIHRLSPRADHHFVVVDCAALPETLVESILFGHKKGAFTGAVKDFEGLVRRADGGTLFLDEVGELSLTVQKSFLRFLENRAFLPLGGQKEVKSNFRLIAATNRDLNHMVAEGSFRQDLLFRLNTLTIHLPPLRERREDLEELVEYFLARLAERYGQAPKSYTPEFLRTLAAYDWPGNIRELRNVLEQAVMTAREEPVLYPAHLPSHLRLHVTRQRLNGKNPHPDDPAPQADQPPQYFFPPFRAAIRQALAQAEHSYLKKLMTLVQGDVKKACQIARLSKTRLYDLLKKHALPALSRSEHHQRRHTSLQARPEKAGDPVEQAFLPVLPPSPAFRPPFSPSCQAPEINPALPIA